MEESDPQPAPGFGSEYQAEWETHSNHNWNVPQMCEPQSYQQH